LDLGDHAVTDDALVNSMLGKLVLASPDFGSNFIENRHNQYCHFGSRRVNLFTFGMAEYVTV
jgi:hypothetical protein